MRPNTAPPRGPSLYRFYNSIVSIEVERFFSEQSPLASEVDSFRPRAQQREMALAVAAAIRDNTILVAEAGTGTG